MTVEDNNGSIQVRTIEHFKMYLDSEPPGSLLIIVQDGKKSVAGSCETPNGYLAA